MMAKPKKINSEISDRTSDGLSNTTDSAKKTKKIISTTKPSDEVNASVIISNSTVNNSKRKRQLSATPSTVREQSEQAQGKAAQLTKRGRAGRVASAPFRGLGRLFRPLGKFKLFRLIGYIVAPPYLRNSFKELRLVTWPNRKQSRQLTFAVIVFSLIFGLIAFVTDFALDKLFRTVILKN